jgi:hypothetical protein
MLSWAFIEIFVDTVGASDPSESVCWRRPGIDGGGQRASGFAPSRRKRIRSLG